MAATKRTAKATPRRRSLITLNFSSADRVMVVPEDGDRFIVTAEKAVAACQKANRWESEARRQADEDEEIVRRFDTRFLRPLRAWCERHADRVAACYVPVPSGPLDVYVVGRSSRYDFGLGSELAKLELELVDAGWRVHAMLIPAPEDEDGLRTHFEYDGALEVYGDSQPAPDQG